MYWLTEIEAVNPDTEELCLWAGPRIWADTEEEAKEFCQKHDLGYCKILGRLIDEIPYEEDIIWLN